MPCHFRVGPLTQGIAVKLIFKRSRVNRNGRPTNTTGKTFHSSPTPPPNPLPSVSRQSKVYSSDGWKINEVLPGRASSSARAARKVSRATCPPDSKLSPMPARRRVDTVRRTSLPLALLEIRKAGVGPSNAALKRSESANATPLVHNPSIRSTIGNSPTSGMLEKDVA